MNCAQKRPGLPDMDIKAERDALKSLWPMRRNYLDGDLNQTEWRQKGNTGTQAGHLHLSSVSTNDKNRLFGCRHT
jgi:hypothetical protein